MLVDFLSRMLIATGVAACSRDSSLCEFGAPKSSHSGAHVTKFSPRFPGSFTLHVHELAIDRVVRGALKLRLDLY